MNSIKSVQILDKSVFILLHPNDFGKGMNPYLFFLAMCKLYNGLGSLALEQSLEKENL